MPAPTEKNASALPVRTVESVWRGLPEKPTYMYATHATLTGFPPSSRTKDIFYYPYFFGGISRSTWRFLTYRLTKASRWLVMITLLFAGCGANSLEVQYYVPFTYISGIWAVAILCALLLRPRVGLKASYVAHIRAGELLPIDLEIEQRRNLPFVEMTVVPHCLPPDLDAWPLEAAAVPALPRGSVAHVRLSLRCSARGVHTWRGFRVESEFPFGLIRSYRVFAQPYSIVVYPRFTPLRRLQVPTGRRYQPGGVALASNLGESMEFIGDREYREGDNIRDIDWRATARLNIPIVREYREEYFLRVGVVLDTFVREDASRAERENFERAVSICAGVSDYMARSSYIVDLFAAGPNLYHLTAGRSLAYLDQILEILAHVDANPEEPFATLEPELMIYLAKITTVICVFMEWDETRRLFVERLQREGAGVKVILVRDTPCTLDPRAADLKEGVPVINAADFALGIEEL